MKESAELQRAHVTLTCPSVSVTCNTYSLSLGITILHAFYTWVLVSWGFYYSSGFNFQGNVIASWAANPATLPGLSDFLEHWHKPQLTYFCTFYSCKTSIMWMIIPTPTASFRYSLTLGLELYAPLCLWSWIWESIVLGRSLKSSPIQVNLGFSQVGASVGEVLSSLCRLWSLLLVTPTSDN